MPKPRQPSSRQIILNKIQDEWTKLFPPHERETDGFVRVIQSAEADFFNNLLADWPGDAPTGTPGQASKRRLQWIERATADLNFHVPLGRRDAREWTAIKRHLATLRALK